MSKEKILKLLKSECLEDVIIGIQYSYKLPIEEFEGLFARGEVSLHLNLSKYGPLYYGFSREDKEYSFGCIAAGINKGYDDTYIDITPEYNDK